eukprot:970523-Pelagomonas_calceolata.AAC.1
MSMLQIQPARSKAYGDSRKGRRLKIRAYITPLLPSVLPTPCLLLYMLLSTCHPNKPSSTCHLATLQISLPFICHPLLYMSLGHTLQAYILKAVTFFQC